MLSYNTLNFESFASLFKACFVCGQFNGTQTKLRLSVFCSDKQLYAMLVDDFNKKCLFYASTLQKSIRGDPPCTVIVSSATWKLLKLLCHLKILETLKRV